MPNLVVIGWAYFKQEHSKISSNFEFDRNPIRGLLHMFRNLKNFLCSDSCMSVSLKYTLMARILWSENPEPWKIVTDWCNLITHLLTYQGMHWSWVTDYCPHLARVDAIQFGILTAREFGLLLSCHYSSVKKDSVENSVTKPFRFDPKPVPTIQSKF